MVSHRAGQGRPPISGAEGVLPPYLESLRLTAPIVFSVIREGRRAQGFVGSFQQCLFWGLWDLG